jgi:two-component system OmpR family response regulator
MLKFAVIEDIALTNDEFKTFLERIWPDCQVSQYLTFESAINGIRSTDFDLIISDIDLGEGTDRFGGVKIAKALDSQRTPFLVVSGSPQPELQREIFRALDAWDYLQKPVTEADFATQARRAIAFRSAQQGNHIAQGVPHDIAGLNIDLSAREMVKWNGRRVVLSMTQIRLLQVMTDDPGVPIPYTEFYQHIDSGRNKQNLRVHIKQMRQAFVDVDPNFDRIETKHMIGYFWKV